MSERSDTVESLRAAAEMVVATGTHRDWYDTIDAGALAVCRAWLREHPADDAEPAAWPWLGTVGFKEQSDGRSLLTVGPWTLEICGGTGGSSLWLNNCPVCDDPTRGDIRRLALALGIGLRA